MTDRAGAGSLETLASAKVNLALAVVGRRPDGYHELVSIFARIDLADRLEARTTPPEPGDPSEPDATNGADRLIVATNHAPSEAETHDPTTDDLVLRALAALRAAHRPDAPGLTVRLEKHIPVAAGLAGGSADAAAALELGARAWAIELGAVERLALAVGLGSDVPFLAADVDMALITGRGEQVEPLPPPVDPVGLILVTASPGLSTSAVFAAYDGGARPHEAAPTSDPPDRPSPAVRPSAADRARSVAARLAQPRRAIELCAMAAELRDANDLWPAARTLRPDLADLREALEDRLGRPTLLSGSGPTMFALYPSPGAADEAAEALRRRPVGDVAASAIRSAAIGRRWRPAA